MQITSTALPKIQELVSSLRTKVSNLIPKQTATAPIKELHSDGLGEKCGVFAYMSKKSSVKIGQIFSSAMQRLTHRGQRAAGYAYFTDDREDVKWTKVSKPYRSDPVNELFKPEVINPMIGKFGLGHTLYATSKINGKVNAQPIKIGSKDGKLAYLVHNGNLPDISELKDYLISKGQDSKERAAIKNELADMNDSQLIAKTLEYFYTSTGHDLEKAMYLMLNYEKFPKGAYSLIAMDKDKIVLVRDRYGNKPLTVGATPDGDIIAASESPAFEPINAKIIRDLEPGEMMIITPKTDPETLKAPPKAYDKHADKSELPTSSIIFPDVQPAFSAFEYVYFSRPDTIYGKESVHTVRRKLGKKLGEIFTAKHPEIKIDYVAPVPESGRSAAEGFSESSGTPLNTVLIKNKHKRTFIEEDHDSSSKKGARARRVKEKFSVIRDAVKDKNILLVDDSIVRSTTVKVLADMLRQAGAASVHFAIPAPPIRFPNFYGIDTPSVSELAASQFSSDLKFAENLSLDSLTFLKPDEFQEIVGKELDMSDFTGFYKIPIGEENEEKIRQAKASVKAFKHLRKLSNPANFPAKTTQNV